MVEALEFVNNLAASIFDIYIIVRLLNTIFKKQIYDKRILEICAVINISVMILLDYYAQPVYINLLSSFILTFILVCCYEMKLWKKILTTLGINFLIGLSEIFIALIIGKSNLSFMIKAENSQSLAVFFSRMVLWIIFVIISRIANKDNPNKLPVRIVILEIVLFATMICEMIFFCTNKKGGIVIESAVLLSSELTVYLMIYLQDCLFELYKSKELSSIIEHEKDFYKKEAVILQQKNELESQFWHDWNNRMQVLNNIAECENVSALKDFVLKMDNKAKMHKVYSGSGILIVDSIINSKLTDAENQNIEVAASVKIPSDIEVDADDMVVILGNLLDNAIEACERVNSHKYIKVSLKYKKGCLFINVRNSFDNVIEQINGEYITRKNNKALHGIGLKSVKATIDKYNGGIKFLTDKDEFNVHVMLYL